jgi:N-dimethylarginine dimethylaminohydrolase
MTYSVYQHWDPLKVCIVGKSYSPEFYSYIKNNKAREVMQRIARETEEDYQKLITLLESFNVKVLRPDLTDNYLDYIIPGTNRIAAPPMVPRDYCIMLGDKFYFSMYNKKKTLIPAIKCFESIFEHIRSQGNEIIFEPPTKYLEIFNASMSIRVGKDLYIGDLEYLNSKEHNLKKEELARCLPNYRVNLVRSGGHADGVMCPVKPGLIITLRDVSFFEKTFPNWETIFLDGNIEGWHAIKPFGELRKKNRGKWWVAGEELNDDFTNYVETWLNDWVGYVEETVFDVNMLVIDEHNVVCNNYRKEVFDAFERHGMTPHILNFRHRYFWDGGLHCITSDINRLGEQKDYFPERG